MEFEKLCGIIARVLSLDTREITPQTTFIEELGADSIDIAQILMGIKEEFGIAFREEEIREIRTVADAVAKIEKAGK